MNGINKLNIVETALDWETQFGSIAFSKTASNEWYGAPDDHVDARERAKRQFIEDDSLDEPLIEYPRLTPGAIDPLEARYQRLLNTAETDEQYEKAARRLAEVYRHKEVLRRLGELSVRNELRRDRAASLSADIYGDIVPDIYLGMMGNLRRSAEKLASVMREARELLELLGDVDVPEWINPGIIEQQTLDVLHNDFEELFPGALALFDDARVKERVSPEEAEVYGQALIDHVGLGASGWKYVVVKGSRQAAATNAAEKTISVGELRANYRPEQMIKSDFHEITHAIRLSGAFARPNAAFEEAFCVGVEQIMTKMPRAGSGEQYYMAIGVQQGLDKNGEQRSFREAYEIMWRRAIVLAAAKGEILSESEAKQNAYTEVLRTRRGGAVDTRDISYFNGSQIVPKWFNNLAKQPKEERIRILRWALSASFDPTNPEHTEGYPAVPHV